MTTPTIPQQLRAQAQARIQEAMHQWLRHLGLVIRNNSLGDISQILSRPDISQGLQSALGTAQEAALYAVTHSWAHQSGPASATLASLQADVSRSYDDAAHQISAAVTQAWHSVPQQQFVKGVSAPGTQPLAEMAAQRAQAAQEAASRVAGSIALRNSLSASVAASAGRTEAAIEAARADAAISGKTYGKRWVSRLIPGVTCLWCWELHGTVVPLDAEFPHPGIASRPDRQGRLRRVRPPRMYRGVLPGPPLHPHCECRIEVVELAAAPEPGALESPPAPEQPHPYISSDDIRAMPEERYQGIIGFLRSALHELGQVLSALLNGLGRGQ